jgi:hypothetical protein
VKKAVEALASVGISSRKLHLSEASATR